MTLCPQHKTPMRPSKQEGEFYCTKKNADGTWCQEKVTGVTEAAYKEQGEAVASRDVNWDLIGMEKSVIALAKSLINAGMSMKDVAEQAPEIVKLAKRLHDEVYKDQKVDVYKELENIGNNIW